MPGRLVTVLAGATVLAASAMAGGPAAAAPQAGHPGPWGLARLLPRGIGSARLSGHVLAGLPGHVLRARDLPRGGQGLPEPGAASLLEWVFCPSSSDCWAVGTYNSGHDFDLNEVLHWNGKKWSLTAVPQPGGTGAGDVNALNGVRCTSPGNCLAVGTYGTTATMFNETLHWTGTAWSQVAAPSPGGRESGAS